MKASAQQRARHSKTQKSKKGAGTIRSIKDRETGAITGYRALLPEDLSRKRPGSPRFRQPVGPVHSTWREARHFLDVALATHIAALPSLEQGLRVIDHLDDEIKARHQAAMRAGMSETQANKQTAAWRSHRKWWVKDAAFASLPPATVDRGDVQAWVDELMRAKGSRSGRPLASNTIHNMVEMIRAAFRRAEVKIDPTQGLRLPARNEPKIPHLELEQQRALLGCADIPLRDRLMIGCGMGAGLRVNELLSVERSQVKLDSAQPHLLIRYGGKGRAPTKGRSDRRVELFEPGLGFWRLFLAEHAAEGALIFAGPFGGYPSAWPEQFQAWGKLAGLDALTSHYMRHSYAVSMLSGSWGYEPRTLEFIKHQLGHTEIQTTERYYGAFTVGTWAREVAIMTGQIAKREIRKPVTAVDLLGASNGAKSSKSPSHLRLLLGDGQLTKPKKTPNKKAISAKNGASAHHSTGGRKT